MLRLDQTVKLIPSLHLWKTQAEEGTSEWILWAQCYPDIKTGERFSKRQESLLYSVDFGCKSLQQDMANHLAWTPIITFSGESVFT